MKKFKGIKKVYTCAICSALIVTKKTPTIKIITEFFKPKGGKRFKITTVICTKCKQEYDQSIME
jgi:DNA-directed RNA polymerase subunit RPC12/RpoP